MLNSKTIDRIAELRSQFDGASPFRHVVIDDFFDEAFCKRLLDEFPTFDENKALNEMGLVGGKAVTEKIRDLGGVYKDVDTLFASGSFRDEIAAITGIPSLLFDEHYFGGGTHENLHGQDLNPHIDFNYHPHNHRHRRLNLLVYLNTEWQEDWGGALELHSDPHSKTNEVSKVLPVFNRAVIFETSEISWHGFSRINLPEEKRHLSRKSVALYYYTAERPDAADDHSTVYVERPLPDHLTSGHVLTAEDVATINRLVTRRDQHITQLYKDVQRLMTDNHKLMTGNHKLMLHLTRIRRVLAPLFFVRNLFRRDE